ncbi:MAG: hypothetical protein ACFWUC_00500 [Oscillospiraceae bacterium]|jgi:hypothetical protein
MTFLYLYEIANFIVLYQKSRQEFEMYLNEFIELHKLAHCQASLNEKET